VVANGSAKNKRKVRLMLITIVSFVFFMLLYLCIKVHVFVTEFKLNYKVADSSSNLTTNHLPSIGSATCNHDWEKVVEEKLETEKEKKFVLVMKCGRCGSIDKTFESSVKECKHSWKVESEVVVESPYEQIKYSFNPAFDVVNNKWIFTKSHLIVYVCEHCGMMRESKVGLDLGAQK